MRLTEIQLADYVKLTTEGHIQNINTGHVYKPYVNHCGYQSLKLLGHTYLVHRIIYALSTGEAIPDGYQVDHKDCDKLNNSMDNLRLATISQQAMNRKGSSNRVHNLPKGVYMNGGPNKATKPYLGRVVVNKKRYSKSCATVEEALEWAMMKRRELHGEFYLD